MLDHLKSSIETLDSKISQIPCDSEKAQLSLILHSTRVLLAEGDFVQADELLTAISGRVEFLIGTDENN